MSHLRTFPAPWKAPGGPPWPPRWQTVWAIAHGAPGPGFSPDSVVTPAERKRISLAAERPSKPVAAQPAAPTGAVRSESRSPRRIPRPRSRAEQRKPAARKRRRSPERAALPRGYRVTEVPVAVDAEELSATVGALAELFDRQLPAMGHDVVMDKVAVTTHSILL